MGTQKLSLTGSVSLGTGVMIGAGIFGAYTLRLFPEEYAGYASALGVGLLALAFIVNVLGNKVIGATATTTAIIKVAGIALLAITGLAIAGFPDITGNFVSNNSRSLPAGLSFIAALALSILAYKGFTTITNQGDDIQEPHKTRGGLLLFQSCYAL